MKNKIHDNQIDPPCPPPFSPEASGVDPDEIEDEEMNTHYVKNPKSEPTDKPFPTPDEFWKLLEGLPSHQQGRVYEPYADCYQALQNAEKQKYWRKLEQIPEPFQFTNTRQGMFPNSNTILDNTYKELYVKAQELQQQLDEANKALAEVKPYSMDAAICIRGLEMKLDEANKRIAELEHRTTRFRK